MATGLLPSRFRTNDDLARLRRLLGWQAAEHDGRMRCRSIPLTDLQPDKFVFFTSYALAGLAFSMSSFLFMLLEYYDLQLQHLSPHSLMLVAIFVHFCDVHLCAAVSAVVSDFSHVTVIQEEPNPSRHLLLPAPSQGSGHIHHVAYPWQVGAVEGRLGDYAG
jgi:hypothetical protein